MGLYASLAGDSTEQLLDVQDSTVEEKILICISAFQT